MTSMVLHLSGHPGSLEVGARHPDDERHPHGGVVNEVAMLVLAVLAEALAVISDDHHNRVVRQILLLKPIQDAANMEIGICDFAIVEPSHPATAESAAVRLGGIVGDVGIVKVEPCEEGPAILLTEPLEAKVHNLVRPPLDPGQIETLVGFHLDVVLETFEALVEAPPLIENEGADDGAASIAGFLQSLGEGHVDVGQSRAAVEAHAVEGRVEPGHDRRVRGQGEGGRCDRLLEEHTF